MRTKRVRAYSKKRYAKSKKIKTSVIPLGSVPRPLSLLGAKVTTKLRYIEKVTLNAAASGIPATYVFAANGVYDPNITGTGHQPRGFDQLALLFDHNYVVSSKIVVDFSTTSNLAVAPWCCGIVLDDDTTPGADMIEECEARVSNYKLVNDYLSPRITLGFNSKTYFTRFKESLIGTGGANPSELALFTIFAQAVGASDLGNINCIVTIEFDVEFTEPKNVGAS